MEVLLANPRGFCAGVDRAIEIVERALEVHGAPIYVRHEVVHNKFVVEDLRRKGAIFVEQTSEIPVGATAIFSAHGVSQAVRQEASRAIRMHIAQANVPIRVLRARRGIQHHLRPADRLDRLGEHRAGVTEQITAGALHPVIHRSVGDAPDRDDRIAGIVIVGVERLARRGEGLDALRLQRVEESPSRELDALGEVRRLGDAPGVIDRQLEVVERRQQVGDQRTELEADPAVDGDPGDDTGHHRGSRAGEPVAAPSASRAI